MDKYKAENLKKAKAFGKVVDVAIGLMSTGLFCLTVSVVSSQVFYDKSTAFPIPLYGSMFLLAASLLPLLIGIIGFNVFSEKVRRG